MRCTRIVQSLDKPAEIACDVRRTQPQEGAGAPEAL